MIINIRIKNWNIILKILEESYKTYYRETEFKII